MNRNSARVMIVEDEVLIGLMLARKLRSFGYDVPDVVTSGEDAIVRVAFERPEVILMDVTLAGHLSGIEAARIIKDKYAIPIIIFSGYDDRAFYEQAEELEPVAVLKKMGPVSDITAAIEKAVGR